MTIEDIDYSELEPAQIAAEVQKVEASSFIRDSYGTYAYYVINHRALIGDDGLKPVNKRILYSMYEMGITPSTQHQKAARIVGDVMKWHPHGDSSIAEALARMAQTFSLRVPLIDYSGTVGFTTGDEAAAPRYWEARLTPAAMELLKEIKDGSVELGLNFDGQEKEPPYLPVRFPLNLVNGSEGIAVGYASNFPSHNPTEVIKAVQATIENPEITVDEILNYMPGPDFPTGGEIVSIDGIKDYYETGRGRVVVRGKYEIEKLARGKVNITFYELPFQVSAEKMIESVKKAQENNKLKDVAKIQDFTDRDNGLNLTIETKAGTNYKNVIAEVFKETPAENAFSVNGTFLLDGKPQVVGVLELIHRFIAFRKACIIRRSQTRLEKIDARLYQLDALLKALVDIDKAIAIIRKSDEVEVAKTELMKAFKLEDKQAEYILSMQLRRLTKADSISIQNENDKLVAEKDELNTLLADDNLLVQKISEELAESGEIIADERRTVISNMTAEQIKEQEKRAKQAAKEASVEKPCWIVRFANGTIMKTMSPYAYPEKSRGYKNSPIIEQFEITTLDEIVIVGSDGIGYKTPVSYLHNDIPSTAEDLGVDMTAGSTIIGISKVPEKVIDDTGIFMMTNKGNVKLTKPEYPNRESFPVFRLADDEYIVNSHWKEAVNGYIVSIASNGNLLVFEDSTVRASGAQAGGVIGQKISEEDEIVHFNWIPQDAYDEAKVVTQANLTIKVSDLHEYTPKGRATQGMRAHAFKKDETVLKDGFVTVYPVATLKGEATPIILPPPTKRTTVGEALKFPLDIGAWKTL